MAARDSKARKQSRRAPRLTKGSERLIREAKRVGDALTKSGPTARRGDAEAFKALMGSEAARISALFAAKSTASRRYVPNPVDTGLTALRQADAMTHVFQSYLTSQDAGECPVNDNMLRAYCSALSDQIRTAESALKTIAGLEVLHG